MIAKFKSPVDLKRTPGKDASCALGERERECVCVCVDLWSDLKQNETYSARVESTNKGS